jgi:hypothetical protein
MSKRLLIQITKCRHENFWYSNKIGVFYDVCEIKWDSGQYMVIRDNRTRLYIRKEDCVVITREMKLKRIKNCILEKIRECRCQ